MDSQNTQNSQDSRESQKTQDSDEQRDSREANGKGDNRDSRDGRDAHNSNDKHDSQDSKDNRDSHGSHDSHDVIPKDLPKISRKQVILLGIAVVILFVAMFAIGFVPHMLHERQLRKDAQAIADAPPIVDVVLPKKTGLTEILPLPGSVMAMQQTAIYARVNGYLKDWKVDLGDKVKQDQLLAEIDSPETDADLEQAQASLAQAVANAAGAQQNDQLATATYQRYKGLIPSGSVTQQDLDTRQTTATQASATLKAAEAAVQSAQATVDRLSAQKKFESIRAPFPGTITQRTYDVGALISVANTAAGSEMFDIAETDRLRVFVDVPQTYVTLLQPHQLVKMQVTNYPGVNFPGELDRTAGALDPNTRTLRVQLNFENKDGRLYAGMYGRVAFDMHREKPVFTVPTSAMMFESEGTLLAIVTGDTVHFRKVVVGRDLGTEIEIPNGLHGDEQVVANPGEKLTDGLKVHVAKQPTESNTGGAATQPGAGTGNAATQPGTVANSAATKPDAEGSK